MSSFLHGIYCFHTASQFSELQIKNTEVFFFPWLSVLVSPWGDACMGHVPSRRLSPSASTSGSNPPWRTWRHRHCCDLARPHTPVSPNPNELPKGPRAWREVGHWRWSRMSPSVKSFIQLYQSCFLSFLCCLWSSLNLSYFLSPL